MFNSSAAVKNESATFNDAIGTLGRINMLFYKEHEARISLEVNQWFNVLMSIHEELSVWADMNEKKALQGYKPKILTMLKKPYVWINGNIGLNGLLFKTLEDYAFLLREIWHKNHLDMKAQEPDYTDDSMGDLHGQFI
jgi:hypothetical protein